MRAAGGGGGGGGGYQRLRRRHPSWGWWNLWRRREDRGRAGAPPTWWLHTAASLRSNVKPAAVSDGQPQDAVPNSRPQVIGAGRAGQGGAGHEVTIRKAQQLRERPAIISSGGPQ